MARQADRQRARSAMVERLSGQLERRLKSDRRVATLMAELLNTISDRDEAVIRADMRAAAIVKALRAEGVRQPQIVELSMGVVGGRELGRLGRIELPPGLENGEVDQAP